MAKRRKNRSRLDIIRDTRIDDWVLGLILVGIPFSVGMWLVVSTVKEWLDVIFPSQRGDVVSFVSGLGIVIFSIWLSKKLRLEKPSP